jgi:uncharacterized protein YdgA (DUF945 family)
MKKWVWAVSASLVLTAGLWMGVSVLLGHLAERELADLHRAGSGPRFGLDVSHWRHERGLFESSGSALVTLDSNCAEPTRGPVTLAWSYAIDHRPSAAGWARLNWQLRPHSPMARDSLAKLGAGAGLGGQGALGWAGRLSTEIELPALRWRQSGAAVDLPASTGQLQMQGRQLRLQWGAEQIHVRVGQQHTRLRGLAGHLDLNDWRQGTGQVHLHLKSADSEKASLAGLSLNAQALVQGDRLNMAWSAAIDKAQADGHEVSALRLKWVLEGLHAPSTERLIALAMKGCEFRALAPDDGPAIAQALQTILFKGFSFGMPQIKGRISDGALDGSVMLDLTEASGNQVSLAEQFRSRGEISVSGAAVKSQWRSAALASGLAVAEEQALVGRFEYRPGQLLLNGQPQPAALIDLMLVRADQGLQRALAVLQGSRREDRP